MGCTSSRPLQAFQYASILPNTENPEKGYVCILRIFYYRGQSTVLQDVKNSCDIVLTSLQ